MVSWRAFYSIHGIFPLQKNVLHFIKYIFSHWEKCFWHYSKNSLLEPLLCVIHWWSSPVNYCNWITEFPFGNGIRFYLKEWFICEWITAFHVNTIRRAREVVCIHRKWFKIQSIPHLNLSALRILRYIWIYECMIL